MDSQYQIKVEVDEGEPTSIDIKKEEVSTDETTDDVVKKEIEAFLSAPFEIDDTQYPFVKQEELGPIKQEPNIKIEEDEREPTSIKKEKVSIDETTEDVVKKEIEAFLSAPFEIDDTQYPFVKQEELGPIKQEPNIICETTSEETCSFRSANIQRCHTDTTIENTDCPVKIGGSSPVNFEAINEEWLPPSSPLATDDIDEEPEDNPDNDPDANEQGTKQGKDIDCKRRSKKDRNLCVFCETEVTNLARHLTRMHSSEAEVIRLESKPKNSKERRDVLTLIRNKGNVSRSTVKHCEKPVQKNDRPTSYYMPCTYCFKIFSKKILWKHKKHCPQNGVRGRFKVNESQNLFLGNIRVDERLKTEVFPRMRADHVSLIAKKDKLICAYAARYLKTHREKHFISVTSRKMRELAKLLIEVRRLDSSISNLFDALKPVNYGLLTQTIKQVAKYSEKDDLFQ